MKGMILAAGFGTRLRPLTWTTPKPMVRLCNRPLVAWAIESYLAAGIDDLVINVHHLPEAIERFVTDTYGSRVRVRFSFEQEILGTGGAIRRARPLLEGAGEFFLVNGDTVQFPRFAALSDARQRAGAIAALTLRHPPANDRFTPVWHEEGRVTGFGEGSGEPLMFAGSHAISTGIFDRLPQEEVFGIVDRVYQPELAAGGALGAVVDDGLWFDVGTPARYLSASAGLLAAMVEGRIAVPDGSSIERGSLAGEGTRVPGLLQESTAGAGCRIEGTVRTSIVGDGCVIGAGVELERCVVGDGVHLSGGRRLRDAVICVDDPAIPAETARDAGLVITA
jgi:NDP-sugar pyrophosphorylase family protein